MNENKMDWHRISAFAEPGQSPGFNLWRTFMRWQRGLNTQLKPLGLTQPQFSVLAVCGWKTRHGQGVSQQEIVDFLGFDRMHISQIATRLEQDGLILREVAPSDLRAKHLSLTTQGRSVLSRAMPLVQAYDQAFFAQIPQSPQT